MKEPMGARSQPRDKPGSSPLGARGLILEERSGFHPGTLISVKLGPQQLGSMNVFKSVPHFYPEAHIYREPQK